MGQETWGATGPLEREGKEAVASWPLLGSSEPRGRGSQGRGACLGALPSRLLPAMARPTFFILSWSRSIRLFLEPFLVFSQTSHPLGPPGGVTSSWGGGGLKTTPFPRAPYWMLNCPPLERRVLVPDAIIGRAGPGPPAPSAWSPFLCAQELGLPGQCG